MGELAVGAINWPPTLRDGQDRVDLDGRQGVHRMPARGKIRERADITSTLTPTMHPIIGHLPQRTHPTVRVPAGDRVVDDLEDHLFRFGVDA